MLLDQDHGAGNFSSRNLAREIVADAFNLGCRKLPRGPNHRWLGQAGGRDAFDDSAIRRATTAAVAASRSIRSVVRLLIDQRSPFADNRAIACS